jgi:hypothetical protein
MTNWKGGLDFANAQTVVHPKHVSKTSWWVDVPRGTWKQTYEAQHIPVTYVPPRVWLNSAARQLRKGPR